MDAQRFDPTTQSLAAVFPPAPPCFPTLAFIDRACGELWASFADDPHAEQLEQLARRLVDQYWSDSIWLTGTVPAAAFRCVCEELERERACATRATAAHTESAA